jgi:tRNA splicing ligase
MSCSPAITPEQLGESTSLVDKLQRFGESDKKLGKLIRSSTYTVADQSNREHCIQSWKMSDYAYKRDPCPFPTLARGLFTEALESRKHKIVARGYDKVTEAFMTSNTCVLKGLVDSSSMWAKCGGPRSVTLSLFGLLRQSRLQTCSGRTSPITLSVHTHSRSNRTGVSSSSPL